MLPMKLEQEACNGTLFRLEVTTWFGLNSRLSMERRIDTVGLASEQAERIDTIIPNMAILFTSRVFILVKISAKMKDF